MKPVIFVVEGRVALATTEQLFGCTIGRATAFVIGVSPLALPTPFFFLVPFRHWIV